jgi:hypothetical protein
MLLSTLDWKAAILAACIVPVPALAQTAAQLKEDLDWYRREVFAVERSYTPAARAEAERRLRVLEGALNKTSPLAFEIEIARIVALADNGHSGVNATGRARRANRVAIRLATFGNEFRVLRTTEANAYLLGGKLIAIDGKPVSVARDSARTLQGGTPEWRDRTVPLALESPEQLHVLGIAKEPGAATYTFETEDRKSITRRLVGEPGASTDAMRPDFLLYGLEQPGTVAMRPPNPWSLQDAMTAFRWRTAPEIDGLVIQLRRVVNGPNQAIGQFLDSMKVRIAADRPRNVVIDMRMNTGGDLNNARDFMKALPSLVPGRVFVITGPVTFSAAISSVGYLEQAAPERVTIVGEESGDRLVFFAEGRPATAPNTRMMVGLATERHDYRNGCAAFTDCHGAVVRFPIAVPSLKPDIPAPLTYAEWKAGRDPAMDAIARALRR